MATENLQIPDIAASQNQKEVTANAAHNLLDRKLVQRTLKAITVDTSFTNAEARENTLIELTGTPGAPHNIDMNDTNENRLAVFNNTDAVMTIRNSAGGGTGQPVIGVGEVAEFQYTGTNFDVLSVASFLGLTDTPSSFSGQALKALTINSGATAVVFTDAGAGGADASGFLTRNELFHARDEKSSGTNAGAFTAGSYVKRDLGTLVTNDIGAGASLSSDQITLPAGEYYMEASAPANRVDQHKIKLRDTTGAVDLLIGTSAFNEDPAGENASTTSVISGRFTLGVSSVLELQHRCTVSNLGTGGRGVAASFGDVEVYTDVRIWQLPGVAFKPPVRVATVVNGVLATAFENGDTVDGITLATNDRILLTDQSTAAENGIYVVNVSGAPTRAADMDADADLGLGSTIAVLSGTVNARTIWMHTAGTTIAGSKTFELIA